MNARWLVFDYIDTSLSLTRKERRAISNCAKRIAFRSWSTRIAFVVVVLMAILAWLVLWWQAPRWIMRTWAVPISLVVGYIASLSLGIIIVRHCIYQAMVKLGYPTCGKCGYWLRGLGDDVKQCPECGAERVPMPPSSEDVAL